MSSTSAVNQNTLKACLQADPSQRRRFATAINFNSPANIGRRGSVGAKTILTTASTATSISIHLLKPKTIWRYGMQKAVRVWRRRTGKKRSLHENTCSLSRTASRLSVKHVHRSDSVRAPTQRPSSPRETEPQPIIKRTTLILANPTRSHSEEAPVSEPARDIRFSHPVVRVVVSALPTPASTLSFAAHMIDAAGSGTNTCETQDAQTPRTGDFKGSVNPSNVHGGRSNMSREQSDRRLDGLPPSLKVRGSSGPATRLKTGSVPVRAHERQPPLATPRLPFVPAQPPFRADSLRSELNRCSGIENGPEHAWAKLHQSQPPKVDQADFERFVRGYAGHQQRSNGNNLKPLPSAPSRNQYQSYQPGRPAPASQSPFVAERPLPTPPMPTTPPAPLRPRHPQYQSYHPDTIRDPPAMPAPPFVPRAPMPPTPLTPPSPLPHHDQRNQPADATHRRAANNARASPSTAIRAKHQRQSPAYDSADLAQMDDAAAPPAKPPSTTRKPGPSPTRKIRRSRLHADLPAVPEVDTPVAETSPAPAKSLRGPVARDAARAVGVTATARIVFTAAPPPEVAVGGMVRAMMQLTSEVRGLRSANESLASTVKELGERLTGRG